ncbi:valine--tRNA ligase [Coemansia sp. RSA 990]|nr:valine--tRNA ligase [Coemansia sp. RSA 990]
MRRLGTSFDWGRERFTLDKIMTRATYEAFVRLFDDGIIFRSDRLVNWCHHLNTSLSNVEVEDVQLAGRTLMSVPGYPANEKFEFGVLVHFAYQIEDSDERIVVATTRIETMLGDTAIAAHPDDTRYKHLHGKFARHPFVGRHIPIITDAEFVDMEYGTGAVKVTPAHDFNDYAVGQRHNLEFINLLNEDGTYNANAGSYSGMRRFHIRRQIVSDLQAQGLYVDFGAWRSSPSGLRAIHLLVRGKVDIDQEIGKIEKKITKTTQVKDTAAKKTQTPKYIAAVPDKIKQADQAKISNYDTEIEALQNSIRAFLVLKGDE